MKKPTTYSKWYAVSGHDEDHLTIEKTFEGADEEISELRKSAEVELSSRRMFVARLEDLQQSGDHWLTVTAVLALLNDCDMLAVSSAIADECND